MIPFSTVTGRVSSTKAGHQERFHAKHLPLQLTYQGSKNTRAQSQSYDARTRVMSKHGLWAVPTLFPYPVRPYTPPHSREPLISHHLLLTYRTLLQSPSTSAGQFQAIRSVPADSFSTLRARNALKLFRNNNNKLH